MRNLSVFGESENQIHKERTRDVSGGYDPLP